MPHYDYECQECGNLTIEAVRYELRDEPLDCEGCGEEQCMKRVYRNMPSVPKASYIDGHKRAGWSDMLTEARLKESAATRKWNSNDVREINKELNDREDFRKERKAKIQSKGKTV